MLGERSAGEVSRARSGLLPAGIDLVQAEVLSLDAARREVRTGAGTFHGDHLVVALGADLGLEAVPGLAEAAHTFYTMAGAAKLRRALEAFPGGRMLLLIPRAPFQCPPGPYEAALLLHAQLERRGIRSKTALEVWTLEKAPMPTAGPEMGAGIVALLEFRGIGFHPLKKAARVDAARRAVAFEDGTETSYDLLIAVPPHRAPRVVVEAGLAGAGGWIPVHPETMEVSTEGAAAQVYAVGDVTSVPLPGRFDPSMGLVLPKAGVFAAAQGEVVAARIAAAARGERPTATFDGRGFCFIEVGGGRAMRAEGSFFDTPHPRMAAREPDEAQSRAKEEWVAGWLRPAG
jgi:sulfide:quinone oxidoreductase